MLDSLRVPRRLTALLVSLTMALTALVGSAGIASAQPTSYPVEIFAPVSVVAGQPFDVRVEVINDNYPVPDRCGSVVLTAAPRGLGTLKRYTAGTLEGIVTFAVTLDGVGGWVLDAYFKPTTACAHLTFGTDTHWMAAVAVPPGVLLPPCPSGMTCAVDSNGSKTAAVLIAPEGSDIDYAWELYDSATEPLCGKPPLDNAGDGGVLWFNITNADPEVTKKAILAVAPKAVKKRGIGRLRVCWTNDANESWWLSRCKRGEPGPCILFKKSTKRNAALVGVRLPPGDPKLYLR